MLLVGKDLASYTLAAGEPFVLEVQLLDSAGRGIDLDDQAMVLTFYTAGTRAVVADFAGNPSQYEGERLSDTTGEYFRWAFDGRWSDAMLNKPGLRVELAQRLFYGRRIISTGTLSVVSSAAIVPSLPGGSIALTAVRVTIKDNAVIGGAPLITQTVILYDGPSVPVAAPVFTTPTSVASDGTPQVGELLTGIDGVATNAASYTRRWLLGSTVLTNSATYTPTEVGSYRYETIATGPGGETTSGSNITVAAASPVLGALTLSPTTATAGTSATLAIIGATAGSVITGTVPAGMTLNSAARTITGTPTTAGSPSIVLTETLAGATGSPRQSTVGVTIAAAPVTPVLGTLTVSPSSATVGTAYSGTINGLTSGSSIALSGAGAAGLSIAGGVITGTPTTAGAVNLIETLAGATGSPRTSSGVVTVAAAAPVSFSRMAATQAADTSNNTSLISALAANNARPSYTLTANTPRTIAWKLGAVASPGAFIAYIVDKSGYTAVAEQSTDSTNGVDGTWSRLTDALVFPAGGTSSQGAANTRQIALVPNGPASWVRLALTHTASANVYYPAVYQRPTSGLSNVWLGVGASLEGYGMWSKDMEDAIVAAYPAQDPVFLRYAVGGTTVSTIKNSPAEVAATHWANLFSYVIVGNAIGNDITNNQPISGTSQTTINTIRTNYDTLLNGFPGKIVFPVRTTYRAYSGVSPTAQAGGSLPFNQQIVDPSVAANQSSAYDSALAIPRVDLYSTALLNRGSLNSGDPVHYSTYVWYQAELVRTAVRFAYTGAWPVSFIETQVAKAESTTLAADINEAQYSIDSLATSSAKTAFQNRLNAISLTISGTPGAATQGVAYSYTPTTTGGTAPITYARSGTALPAGLSFNTATGAITGTPTIAANTTGIIITATDSSNPAKTASQTIAINVAASGSFLINDTFTTGSDTDLSAHAPETGGAWTPSTASTVFVSAATGRGRKGVSTAGIYATYLNAAAPTATNYDIDIDIQFPTVFSFFVVLRALSDANNVFAGYSTSNGWTLGTRISATNTTVNNTAFTAPAGSTSYHLKIQVRGDVMTLLVDGVSKATGTITAKPGTLVGIEYPTTSFAGSDTVGPQFDNFRVTENPA